MALLSYMVVTVHGFGAVLSEPARLGWGGRFWPVFFPSPMGMIAFWSTLSLNMPDFTRFGRGQRQQAIGPGARPADHDDVLLAARGADHRGVAAHLRDPDLGSPSR